MLATFQLSAGNEEAFEILGCLLCSLQVATYVLYAPSIYWYFYIAFPTLYLAGYIPLMLVCCPFFPFLMLATFFSLSALSNLVENRVMT